MAERALVLLALFGQMHRAYTLERAAHARAVATPKGRRIGGNDREGRGTDAIVWQTGTAWLLPRLLGARRRGPVMLTDRRTGPSVALVDVDAGTGRARLLYRRVAMLLELYGAELTGGPYLRHQLRRSVR